KLEISLGSRITRRSQLAVRLLYERCGDILLESGADRRGDLAAHSEARIEVPRCRQTARGQPHCDQQQYPADAMDDAVRAARWSEFSSHQPLRDPCCVAFAYSVFLAHSTIASWLEWRTLTTWSPRWVRRDLIQ